MSENNLTGALDELLGSMKSAAAPFRQTLQELHAKYRDENSGKVADYIPELALADPNWFGISVVTTDGQTFNTGDCEQTFSIQSVSKPFVFGMALEDDGREAVLKKVGVEPTGEAFNAIVLDEKSNRPFNPLVNAGAIATCDLIEGKDFADRIKRLLAMFARYTGREAYVDNAIFMSERTTGHRNRAIAHLMLNFGMVSERIADSLELYFQQCAILVNARDLAVMGATLANAGVNPITKQRAIEQQYVKDVLSVMLSCGMYDYAGEWAYRIGLPAKKVVSAAAFVQ
jgi:glutaminase